MDETDEQMFKQLVEMAVVEMKEKASTKEFGEYFETNYKCRCEQWANCFRVSFGVNTNMYVEAFHHILKYKFLNGKRNKWLDRLIHALMEFLRHKSFDRLIKFEKGKVTGRIAIIQRDIMLVKAYHLMQLGLWIRVPIRSSLNLNQMNTQYISSLKNVVRIVNEM